MSPRLRALRPGETGLLERATLGNLNWCGPRFTLDDVRSEPRFARYTRLLPGRGDHGLVAEEAGEPIGVVWVSFLPGNEPGYGFLADGVPELSIGVLDGHRGRGTGRALLRGAIAQARRRGTGRISLSVEQGNPARRLYASEGFRAVPGREVDGVMVLDLGGAGARRMGAALLGAGVLHLVLPRPFDGLIPRALPGRARYWTLGSSVVELVVGGLLLHPRTRRAGGWAAAALFVAVWPGNLTMAWRARGASRARRAVAWARLPLQVPMIAGALRIARRP